MRCNGVFQTDCTVCITCTACHVYCQEHYREQLFHATAEQDMRPSRWGLQTPDDSDEYVAVAAALMDTDVLPVA